MRKALVDVGSYNATTTRTFRKWWPNGNSYEVYCFEPDKRYRKRPRNATTYDAAAWTFDGEIDLYIGLPESSSIMRDKATGKLDYSHPVKVLCIDFAKWLKATFKPGDEVIVKLNVEGAEYAILRHLIDTKAIKLISRLFVEWHWYKMIGMTESDHLEVVERLRASGIDPQPIWGTNWIRWENFTRSETTTSDSPATGDCLNKPID